MRQLFLLVFAFAIPFMPMRAMADDACTESMRNALEGADLKFKDWQDFYDFYARYIPCGADASVDEGYSDQTEELLSKQWGFLDQLGEIARKHPDFEKFVLSHIDETTTMEGANRIRYLANKKCPGTELELCKAINRRMTTLDEEIKKDKDGQQ